MSEFLSKYVTKKIFSLNLQFGETYTVTLRSNGKNIADMTKATISMPRLEPVTHFTFAIPSTPDRHGQQLMSYHSVDVSYGLKCLHAHVVDYGVTHESRNRGFLGVLKFIFIGLDRGSYTPREIEQPRPFDPFYNILSSSRPIENEFANQLVTDHIDAIVEEVERIRTRKSDQEKAKEAARSNTQEAKQDKVNDIERDRAKEKARERLKSAERTKSRESDRFTVKEAERRSAKAAERKGNSGGEKSMPNGRHRGRG